MNSTRSVGGLSLCAVGKRSLPLVYVAYTREREDEDEDEDEEKWDALNHCAIFGAPGYIYTAPNREQPRYTGQPGS